MPLAPVSLHGSLVSPEPLTPSRVSELAAVGLHPELWRLQPRAILTETEMRQYVEQALAEQSRGVSLPFVIVRQADQTVVGSTRLMDIALEHRRLEIGATWLTPSAQRTGVNVEAKLLLLSHAFDTQAMQKVVFKTEALNTQSRTAILALGAVEEGTFRRHLIADNGRMRDMVYFSILDGEWPGVRARLRARLAQYATVLSPWRQV
jgi:RimJ/RimL family protein N-acetyltransferase